LNSFDSITPVALDTRTSRFAQELVAVTDGAAVNRRNKKTLLLFWLTKAEIHATCNPTQYQQQTHLGKNFYRHLCSQLNMYRYRNLEHSHSELEHDTSMIPTDTRSHLWKISSSRFLITL